MKKRQSDLLTILTVAVSTATLTVACFWAAPLEAGDEVQQLAPKIPKPMLKAKGAEITLAQVGAGKAQAGAQPEFELEAFNTTGEPVALTVRLLMTAASPADAFSRVVRIPKQLWDCDQSIVLAPHERKIINVATKTALPEKNLISVMLSEVIPGAQNAPASGIEPLLLNARVSSAPPQIAVLTFSTMPVELGSVVTQANSLTYTAVTPLAATAQ